MPAPALERLTEKQAELVYEVLVRCAGAGADPDSWASFVHEFTSKTPTSQYRFQGNLGFGGKFHFPALNVAYYADEKTREREAAARETNECLAELLAQFNAERAQAAAGQ